MADPETAELLARVTDLLGRRKLSQVEFATWLSGTATGGPNGDGLYPFTAPDDTVLLVPSPATVVAMGQVWAAPTEAFALRAEAAAKVLENRGKAIPTATYDLKPEDNGAMLKWTGTATCTVRVPPTLKLDWSAGFMQLNTGRIRFVALPGAEIGNDQGYTQTRAKLAQANLWIYENVGGSAAKGSLGGSMVGPT